MQLFYSPNSPYARIARVALRETGLIEIAEETPARNRRPDNPVLAHSHWDGCRRWWSEG